MTTGIIYLAKNTISNKCYIGQTRKTLEQRKRQHIRDTIKEKFTFSKALRKYPVDSWEWSILAEVDISELDEYERFFIKDLNTFKQGYNSSAGGSWKEGGNPNQTTTIYELWHPEYGEVRETLTELYKRSASFGSISMLVNGKRQHINGYVLLKNKENYDKIIKTYNFYHPEIGIITCTTTELFNNYRSYFKSTENRIHMLTNKTVSIHHDWILAENKNNYENLIDRSAYLTLTHPKHGTLTLKRSEFKQQFGLTDGGMTKLKTKIRKKYKGWVI